MPDRVCINIVNYISRLKSMSRSIETVKLCKIQSSYVKKVIAGEAGKQYAGRPESRAVRPCKAVLARGLDLTGLTGSTG
jgi:hypothetical protein